MSIISYQVQEALSKFQGSVSNNGSISIRFPKRPDLTISVNYSPTFPSTPPSINIVDSNGKQVAVEFPIIKYWIPLYTLSNCLEQAMMFTDIPTLNPAQVDPEDIANIDQRISPEQLLNPESRLEAVRNCPSVAKAIKSEAMHNAKSNELKEKIHRDQSKMEDLNIIYNRLYEDQIRISQQRSQINSEQLTAQAYNNRLEFLKNSYKQKYLNNLSK